MSRSKFEVKTICSQDIADVTSREELETHHIWLKGLSLAPHGERHIDASGYQNLRWHTRMFRVIHRIPPHPLPPNIGPTQIDAWEQLWVSIPPRVARFLVYPPPGATGWRSNEKAIKGGIVVCLTWSDDSNFPLEARRPIDVRRCWPGTWRSWLFHADPGLAIYEDLFVPMLRKLTDPERSSSSVKCGGAPARSRTSRMRPLVGRTDGCPEPISSRRYSCQRGAPTGEVLLRLMKCHWSVVSGSPYARAMVDNIMNGLFECQLHFRGARSKPGIEKARRTPNSTS